MSIWILLVVLGVLFAGIGFLSGAIRMALMFVGVIVASFVTGPIAPGLTSLMPKIGIKHPIWVQFAPFIIIYSLIVLAIYGLGFFVHHKIRKIYETQRDDFSRMKWERMNKHMGISVGLLIALTLLFTIAGVAYWGGYLTAQVEDESNSSNNPGWIKFLTKIRTDMQTTGLDKSVAALDKTSTYYYDAADVVGVVYHNPIVQGRLASYPPFLSLGQRPEFQEIASDQEYNKLIFGKEPFGTIINHPNTQRLLANQEVLTELRNVDLKDLLNYLKTGSSKYDDEKILGRWVLDKDAVLIHIRKTRPDVKGGELIALRKGLALLPDLTLINTLEHKTIVKTEGTAPAPAADGSPAPAAPPQPAVDPRYQRLGQRGGRGQPGGRPPGGPRPTAPAAATPPPVLQIAGEGEWKPAEPGQYELAINDAAGKQQKLTGTILDDELTLTKGPLALVFVRAE